MRKQKKQIKGNGKNFTEMVEIASESVTNKIVSKSKPKISQKKRKISKLNVDTSQEKNVCSDQNRLSSSENVSDKNKPESYNCNICHKLFGNLFELNDHQKYHKQEQIGRFKCNYCDIKFDSIEHRVRHTEQVHMVFKCQICKDLLDTSEGYVKHINEQHNGRDREYTVCENCGQQFKSPTQLNIHMESKCGTLKMFKCEICDMRYMTQATLNAHKMIHKGEKTFRCQHCEKTFLSKGQLTVHERKHTGEKPYKCQICSKAFSYRESLVTHSSVHTGIKPFMCECCGNTFSCIGNLLKHRQKRPLSCGLPQYNKTTKVAPRPSNKIPGTLTMMSLKPIRAKRVLKAGERKVRRSRKEDESSRETGADIGTHLFQIDEDEEQLTIASTTIDEITFVDEIKMKYENNPAVEKIDMKEAADLAYTNDSESPEKFEIENDLRTSEENVQTMPKYDNNYITEPTTSSDTPTVIIENAKNLHVHCEDDFTAEIGDDINETEMIENDSIDETGIVYEIIVKEDNIESNDVNDPSNIQKSELVENYSDDRTINFAEDGHEMEERISDTGDEHQIIIIENINEDGDVDMAEVIKAIEANNEESIINSNREDCTENNDNVNECEVLTKEIDEDGWETDNDGLMCGQDEEDDDYPSSKVEIYEQSETRKTKKKRLRINKNIPIIERDYECIYCPKLYHQRKPYVKHLRFNHNVNDSEIETLLPKSEDTKKSEYQCKYCDRTYVSALTVKKHQLDHGPDGLLIYKSPCCRKYFATVDEATNHAQNEHSDKITCKICKRIYSDPESLGSHLRYAHKQKEVDGASGENKTTKKLSFVCLKCGKRCTTKTALTDHERSNCGRSPLYKCDDCGKHYHSFGSLKTHRTVHTGELPFLCPFCGKAFRTQGQVKVHQRSHSGEKPFKCELCPKSFAYRESLLTHFSIHTGMLRFLCQNCGLRFSCISNLQAHRRTNKSTCGAKPNITKSVGDFIGVNRGNIYIGNKSNSM